jgi:hypothetical protein
MLSIINQKVASTGEGVAASTLYKLASNAATYALAFHDITSGSNECTAGATYCSTAGASKYAATTGYDEASGLGSVDLTNLMNAWAGTTVGSGGGGTGTATFTLGASAVTVAQGSSGTSTVTITPANSYAGTVGFTATSTGTSLNTYGCYAVSNTAVTAGTAATATLTVYTSKSACSVSGVQSFARNGTIASSGDSQRNGGQPLGRTIPLSAAALAGLLCFGFRKSRLKIWTVMSCLILVTMLGMTVGCGSSSGSTTTTTTTTDVTAGTYSVTLTGTDTTTSTITATTSFSVTVN